MRWWMMILLIRSEKSQEPKKLSLRTGLKYIKIVPPPQQIRSGFSSLLLFFPPFYHYNYYTLVINDRCVLRIAAVVHCTCCCTIYTIPSYHVPFVSVSRVTIALLSWFGLDKARLVASSYASVIVCKEGACACLV